MSAIPSGGLPATIEVPPYRNPDERREHRWMNLTEAIYSRRATRAFLPRRVEDAAVHVLLNAAVQAPSAMNTQPWRFAVVQNATQLERYSELGKGMLLHQMGDDLKAMHNAERLKSEAFNIFYDATTLVVIGVDAPSDFAEANCWLAAQNLMLAATEAGLGTCCIGLAVPVLNTPNVRRELGFGAGAVVVAPIIVGYPSAQPDRVSRLDPKIVSWTR